MTPEIKASEENISWTTTHGFRIPHPLIVPLAYIISVTIHSGHIRLMPSASVIIKCGSHRCFNFILHSVTQLSLESTSEAAYKRTTTYTSPDLSRWTKNCCFRSTGTCKKKMQTTTQQTSSMLLSARFHLPPSCWTNFTTAFCIISIFFFS